MGVPDQEFLCVLRLQAYKREEKTTYSSQSIIPFSLGTHAWLYTDKII
jgi:hypothetical protein